MSSNSQETYSKKAKGKEKGSGKYQERMMSSVRLEIGTNERIKQLAKNNNLTYSDVVRNAINMILELMNR